MVGRLDGRSKYLKTDERLSSLDDVLPALYSAYTDWKAAEGEKNGFKDDFFRLADDEIRERGLAIKLVDIPGNSEGQARERVQRHYPEWDITELRPSRVSEQGRDMWEAVLIENPSLKPFSQVLDGIKYARQISKGSVMIDDEWLGAEDPGMYMQVTYQLPWGDVIPLPLDELPKDLIGRLTKYIYTTPPRASLAAPRRLKTEE